MNSLAYCQEKAQASGSSFLAGFRFLPEEQKNAMTVLYAYCRELDDVVDDCSDINVARQTLIWWRQDLDKVFHQQQPEHPVNQALCDIVGKFGLPKDELEDIINGMEMDLHHVRYQTFADLQYYCYRVAGVVGRLIVRILGFSENQTLAYADKLGLALQLTNIIRDVGEDARNGRIYLPLDELAKFGVSEELILSYQSNQAFEKLMDFQVMRARETYRAAVALLPEADRKRQKVGLVMGGIYYALLEEIARDGSSNVLKYKIKIPNPRKLRIALKIWLLGFKP
ncbi:presqualene diphosphate synthase HpnD [Alysiella crassa]|uniref:Dehydrosqualene synthase n=1 Tax=Alysiella crassa TaxID=153491 RepID=A0A376BVG4_9NEIS|nr:presqualene diphosphate synthase HpnD [Alysiella crassa]UOP06293.1 presqualene diphosphate synthase HpnD [Alysiella crassa]SSY80795.1 Dehydrosqualene synthase [Alysiella crassa]